MNGRIYDPGLGRFLQADPLIQDLSNPQSLNRYTYAFNNPLAYTDPTGYSAFSKYLRPILAIGAAYFTAGWSTSLFAAGNTAAALAVSIGGGALTGAIATGSGKGALIGAFTGAAAFGVGSSIAGGGSNGISNWMARSGAQALAGGLAGQVNHGNFGAGFMAAFSVEFGFDTPQTLNSEGSQNSADLNARDASPEQYVSVMGTPEKWFAYESVGTMAQELAQKDFQAGRITLEQLNSIYGYQAGGAAAGALITTSAISGVVGGGILKKNLEFDGPSRDFVQRRSGRIFGVRWKKSKWGARLDYHRFGADPTKILHINIGSLNKGESMHIKLWDPRWIRRFEK